MQFELSEEQQMIVDTVRTFTEKELMPHEEEVERLGTVPDELVAEIKRKSIAAGIYAANMPAELGGGGLDRDGQPDAAVGRGDHADGLHADGLNADGL